MRWKSVSVIILGKSKYTYSGTNSRELIECDEWGRRDATPTKIEYVVEETETIPLCDDCRDEFKDGGFVQDVSPVEQ